MMASSYALRLSAGILFAAMLVAAASSARASVQISSNPTHNMNCSGGVCAPTAKDAVLNATDLTNMLATSDVKVVTGNRAVTIGILSPLTWASANRLTLDANESVNVKAPVVVEGTAGLTIVTNDGGTGGDLILSGKGNVTFWDLGSSLIINGNSFTLVDDIASLAADIAANPSGFYALAKSYNASVDGTYQASPIPTVFGGVFEGLGNDVSHVTFSLQSPVVAGFFVQIGSDGTVRDFALTNISISIADYLGDDRSVVGSLTGQNDGHILNAFAAGTISSPNDNEALLGGLVGQSYGVVVGSSAKVDLVSNGSKVGGLVGMLDGEILNSSAEGKVDGGLFAGGLVGWGTFGKIIASHATGAVTGSRTAGGLVAEAALTIEKSYATGPVTGGAGGCKSNCGQGAGGLVGGGGYITDSYSTGDVTDESPNYIGGMLGSGSTNCATSYSIGHVSATDGSDVGGLIGHANNHDRVERCYWNVDTSGTNKGVGNRQGDLGTKGLTTQELQSGLPQGFKPSIWGQNPNINNGYPYLIANPPPQ